MPRLIPTLALLGAATFSLSAQAALLGRLPATPGGTDYQAYYDTILDITWLADANYAKTSGYHPTGYLTWDESVAFVDSLNASAHLGATTWRLPFVLDVDADGCPGLTRLDRVGIDCGYNTHLNGFRAEMSTMFYDTLGNPGFFDPADLSQRDTGEYGLLFTGPFANLDGNGLYWYGQENVANMAQAWYFGMPSGGQGPRGKNSTSPAWPVLDGDINLTVIPIPAAGWLFLSALGLAGWVRRRAGRD